MIKAIMTKWAALRQWYGRYPLSTTELGSKSGNKVFFITIEISIVTHSKTTSIMY